MSGGEDTTPPLDRERFSYHREGGKYDAALRRVVEAVLIAGVVCVLGFAWNGAISNLRETQSVQAKSIEFLQIQVNDLKAGQLRIEGKVYRSADGALLMDLSDADQRKP